MTLEEVIRKRLDEATKEVTVVEEKNYRTRGCRSQRIDIQRKRRN